MKSISIKFKTPRNPGYEILIQHGLIKKAPQLVKQRFPGCSPFVISSPRVFRLWGSAFKSLPKHLVPDGEEHKSFKEYARGLQALAAWAKGAKIKPVVILLGGGVIGDLGGFVAASYKRGVPFVQIPTTLLSMVDSSVGGKLGIDFDTPRGRIKNLVGAFYQPSCVLIDPQALSTLPARDLASGMGEVVKTALLFDKPLFENIDVSVERLLALDKRAITHVIASCVAHKASIVMKDEFDVKGSRALLNLGHTFGHAVEAASNFKLLHGEAVAFGTCCAVDLAAKLGIADPELMRVAPMLERLGLPSRLPALPLKKVMAALSEDKKFEGGMRFVLPKKIGSSILKKVDDRKAVEAVLRGRFE